GDCVSIISAALPNIMIMYFISHSSIRAPPKWARSHPSRSRGTALDIREDLKGKLHVGDVESEALREPDAVVQLRLEALAVARLHQVADHLARFRPPQRVRCELGEHAVRSLDQRVLHLLRRVSEQHTLVRHAGTVVDP